MEWDPQKVLLNIRKAETDDLLDRVTAFRSGMEPEAVALIERELYERGVTATEIADRRESCERDCLFRPDGTAVKCSFCHKPAVAQGLGWWKAYWIIPIFPRRLQYCEEHRP